MSPPDVLEEPTFVFQVNKSWAIDLIAKDPVVVCTQRVVNSDSGGALGHPKVFINLVCTLAVRSSKVVAGDIMMCWKRDMPKQIVSQNFIDSGLALCPVGITLPWSSFLSWTAPIPPPVPKSTAKPRGLVQIFIHLFAGSSRHSHVRLQRKEIHTQEILRRKSAWTKYNIRGIRRTNQISTETLSLLIIFSRFL